MELVEVPEPRPSVSQLLPPDEIIEIFDAPVPDDNPMVYLKDIPKNERRKLWNQYILNKVQEHNIDLNNIEAPTTSRANGKNNGNSIKRLSDQLLNENHPQKIFKTTQEAAAPINLEQNAPVIKVLASTSNADVMQPLNIAEPVETLNKLVSAPVVTPPNIKETGSIDQKEKADVYSELIRLEEIPLITNSEAFECEVCIKQCNVNEGAILRECIHMVCKVCLADVIKMCQELVVNCPVTGCPEALQDREIRALVTPEDFAKWVARCFDKIESTLTKIESRFAVNNDKPPNIETGSVKRMDGSEGSNIYSELMRLEESALITNSEAFECEVCMEQCNVNEGAILRECIHKFCKGCLADVIKMCQEPVVHCPATGCSGALQDREIRELVAPEDFEKVLSRRLSIAETGSGSSFHCPTADCVFWALCDPGVESFYCPVCRKHSCLFCKVIHEGEVCSQYRARLEAERVSKVSKVDIKTQKFMQCLISKGEAMPCPQCGVILSKAVGCDWLVCSACKTEICWATRGRRWGPKGKGDTSGGCRCRVPKNKKCHPSCSNCH